MVPGSRVPRAAGAVGFALLSMPPPPRPGRPREAAPLHARRAFLPPRAPPRTGSPGNRAGDDRALRLDRTHGAAEPAPGPRRTGPRRSLSSGRRGRLLAPRRRPARGAAVHRAMAPVPLRCAWPRGPLATLSRGWRSGSSSTGPRPLRRAPAPRGVVGEGRRGSPCRSRTVWRHGTPRRVRPTPPDRVPPSWGSPLPRSGRPLRSQAPSGGRVNPQEGPATAPPETVGEGGAVA